MRPLPVDRCLPGLLSALRTDRRAVLVAPPGAGKSTRVPPALLDHGLLSETHPAVVLLQPRRIAARATATRIAQERGAVLGEEVGYQVRFERRRGPRTRLIVATEGVLNRQILADPFLEGVGAVILDEFHERSLHTDLALAYLNEIREAAREDLLLVVMSATFVPEPVARFLGGCPVIRADAPSHPVSIDHAPKTAALPLAEHVAAVLERVLNEDTGDVLVFLPGMGEIRRISRRIEPLARRYELAVLPLHGSLPAEEQDRALRPSQRRKVILSTNVAETSLTIEGIRAVIDTGLARYACHDPARGLDRLELRRISRASADQRAGRAGRTGPGRCVRLWSQREERGMPAFDEPEIRRVDLAPTLLAVHAWGCSDPRRFGWFEPPSAEAVEAAESTLTMLGALDEARHTITPLGRTLVALPAHPRIARLMVEAARIGRLEDGASLAAILSERDILARFSVEGPAPRPPDHGGSESDLLARWDLLERAERQGIGPALRSWGLDPGAVGKVVQARRDLLGTLRGLSRRRPRPAEEPDDEWLLKLPLLAYPDRVCRRREHDRNTGVMVGGRGIRLDAGSVVREARLFLALDPQESASREALVRIASAVRPEWLEELFPGSIREVRETRFDPERQRVVGFVATYYRDLLLSERPGATVDPEQAGAILADALADRAEAIFRQQDACAGWLDRVACLGSWMPELGLPKVDRALLTDCLARACQGCRSAADVARLPLRDWLQARLTPVQQRQLDDFAPETIRVPSGSRLRLIYEPGRPPVLAVRIQELFGWQVVPRVASGRIAVLLHLLAPNFRPVQITDDLESFWQTTYARVRKELRARYPKHPWPEDPLTAEPRSRPGKAPGR